MSRLIHERFLLQSDEAVRLYHDYAAGQPIIDYHTHLPPAEIAADRRWENISQVWLNGDHYKWRQMRANGIAERFCTGDATDQENSTPSRAPCRISCATDAERDQLATALLLQMRRLYREKGWTMQVRIGALRDNNSAMLAALGSDSGYDSMGDRSYAEPLARFLNALSSAGDLPRTILYNVNPRDTEMLASLLACFEDGSMPGKMQLGPAWWFLDQKDGIERQLEAISQIGSLRRFVGMVADSRSFLSFTRHEYFRRILCNLLGAEMASGLLPRDFDLVGALVEDVCFRNAESFFGFELPDRDRDAASAPAPALHAALG